MGAAGAGGDRDFRNAGHFGQKGERLSKNNVNVLSATLFSSS